MCLYYGVVPCESQFCGDFAEFGRMVNEYVVANGLGREGERVMVVGGGPFGSDGVNTILIQ